MPARQGRRGMLLGWRLVGESVLLGRRRLVRVERWLHVAVKAQLAQRAELLGVKAGGPHTRAQESAQMNITSYRVRCGQEWGLGR